MYATVTSVVDADEGATNKIRWNCTLIDQEDARSLGRAVQADCNGAEIAGRQYAITGCEDYATSMAILLNRITATAVAEIAGSRRIYQQIDIARITRTLGSYILNVPHDLLFEKFHP